MHSNRLIGFCLMSCVLVSIVCAGPEDRERLVRLDSHLRAIYTEARVGRLVSGWVLLGTGIGMGGTLLAGGALMDALDIEDDVFGFGALSTYYYIMGGSVLLGFGIPGAVLLNLPGDGETLPKRFFSMPDNDEEERALKVSAGEAMLDSLAAKGRQGRYVSGSLSLGVGIYSLAAAGVFDPLIPGLSERLNPTSTYYGDEYDEGLSSTYLYEGMLFVGTGLLSFLIESRAEREQTAYYRHFTLTAGPRPMLAMTGRGPMVGVTLSY